MAYLERSRDDGVSTKNLDMTKCLMLLSSKNKNRKRPAGFECKTCHREFASFQALGGHRASHKRARLMSDDDKSLRLVTKPRMHECTICGLEFAMGQALGGHMRRHRALLTGHGFPEEFRSCSKRVFELDLNLTPLENDLVVLFGNTSPKLDVFV